MEKLLDEMSHQSSIHTQKLDTIDGVIMAVGEYITLIKRLTGKGSKIVESKPVEF